MLRKLVILALTSSNMLVVQARPRMSGGGGGGGGGSHSHAQSSSSGLSHHHASSSFHAPPQPHPHPAMAMAPPVHTQTTTTTTSVHKSGSSGYVPPIHSFASTSTMRSPGRSTTFVSSSNHYYPPAPLSFGGSYSSIHLHMQPAPYSFLPSYYYEPSLGLTLYHHDHYVHYSVMDMIIRITFSFILLIIGLYLLCYLVELCIPSSQQEARYEEEIYVNDLEDESLIIEDKVEIIHHTDGGIIETRTVATTQFDYNDNESTTYMNQQHAAGCCAPSYASNPAPGYPQDYYQQQDQNPYQQPYQTPFQQFPQSVAYQQQAPYGSGYGAYPNQQNPYGSQPGVSNQMW